MVKTMGTAKVMGFMLFRKRVYAACGLAAILLSCACTGGGQPFDSYVLSLSWSPQHCAETSDTSAECTGTRTYGFVLHGLWPEPAGGRGPQHCAGAAFDASQVTDELRGIMPSDRLIEHEWETHGTCSGMNQTDYFRTAEHAFQMVKIPPAFQPPVSRIETTPREVHRQFAEANSDFPTEAFAVKDDGRFLQEVRVCLTSDLKPRDCARPSDTRDKTIVVRPVR